MYLHPTVSTDKLLKMLKGLQTLKADVHQFTMYYKGEKMVEFAPAPYSLQDKRQVNSVSKTFTATAVGLCYDRGLLKPEDLLISFFPQELTNGAAENIRCLTIHDLLTMCTATEDPFVTATVQEKENMVTTFFSRRLAPMEKRFYYNNSATYMLSAVVSRVAGMTALDLLETEIFRHIGIRNASWPTLDGNSEGCAGLHVCSDDIAKVMQIYQNGGVYNGKRYLSEKWVEMATKVQLSTAHDNNFRWYTNGYGYQMWHNWRGGYRAQGSGGQYGFVFPDLDIVAGIESSCKTADEVFDTYYAFFSDYAGESTVSVRELEAYIDSMYPALGQVTEFEGFEQCYEMEPNAMGITRLYLHREENAVACVFSDGKSVQTMRFGIGNWQENKVYACNFRPQIYSLTVPRREIVHFCASCKDGQNGVLEVLLRFRDCHHAIMLYITAEEQIQLHFDSQDLCPEATLLKGTRRK